MENDSITQLIGQNIHIPKLKAKKSLWSIMRSSLAAMVIITDKGAEL